MNRGQFEALLEPFKDGVVEEPPATFIEVAGFPHLEDVCSNVLAYYFDPGHAHGFGTLLLESLLDGVGEGWDELDLADVEVSREEPTHDGYRIDLWIRTASFLIGIENKLFASVGNPFAAYLSHLKERAAGDGLRVVPILLTLHPVDSSLEVPGFRRITHEHFLNRVLDLMGPRTVGADIKHLTMWLDFVESMSRLRRGSRMNPEVLAMMSEHEEALDTLLAQVGKLQREMRRKVQQVGESLDLSSLGEKVKQRHHRERPKVFDTLVHDIFVSSDIRLALEARVAPSGWTAWMFNRGGRSQDLERWLKERGVQAEPLGWGGRLAPLPKPKFDYDQDGAVVEWLQDFIKAVAGQLEVSKQ